MTRARRAAVLLIAASILVAGYATLAQDADVRLRVPVVDETKTFLSTMRVAALVGALRSLGEVDVVVRLADVRSSYEDPLEEAPQNGAPYDVVITIPRGIDSGAIATVWVLSEAFVLLDASLCELVRAVCLAVDRVFTGVTSAIDVQENLLPALLWARYAKEGWTR